MRLEKLQKQKEYSARVLALARKHAMGGSEVAAAGASGASSQASFSPSPDRPRKQHQQPRPKQPALRKSNTAPPNKHELALARREKMKAFVATIKKPTMFVRGPSPAIVTRAELRAKAAALEDDQSDAGSELRKLEEEHQRAVKEAASIRTALRI
ncbi:hypothetical protein HDU86_006770 [Geranomyces michiganensis]|nr:hypothetical protein HDU86_006770 [Geranomyces michiganensis]